MEFDRLCSGLIGILAVVALLVLGCGYPGVAAFLLFLVVLVATASLVASL